MIQVVDDKTIENISKVQFDQLKELLGNEIKERCDYCGDKITRDNFGFVASGITTCREILCLTECGIEHDEWFGDEVSP